MGSIKGSIKLNIIKRTAKILRVFSKITEENQTECLLLSRVPKWPPCHRTRVIYRGTWLSTWPMKLPLVDWTVDGALCAVRKGKQDKTTMYPDSVCVRSTVVMLWGRQWMWLHDVVEWARVLPEHLSKISSKVKQAVPVHTVPNNLEVIFPLKGRKGGGWLVGLMGRWHDAKPALAWTCTLCSVRYIWQKKTSAMTHPYINKAIKKKHHCLGKKKGKIKKHHSLLQYLYHVSGATVLFPEDSFRLLRRSPLSYSLYLYALSWHRYKNAFYLKHSASRYSGCQGGRRRPD